MFDQSPDTASSASTSRPSVRRRQRPHFNCAECRRTKSKCDRTWPCSECVRKGLSSLCPDSVASTNPSKNETIALLTRRIEVLEDARRRMEQQVARQNETGGDDSAGAGATEDGSMPERAADMSAVLSALALGSNQSKRYVGTEASPFYLETPCESDNEEEGAAGYDYSTAFGSRYRNVVEEMTQTPWGRSGGVPLGGRGNLPGALLDRCRALLPTKKEARDTFEKYWALTSWRIQPLTRSYFLETILPSIYDSPQGAHSHDLAVLLSIHATTMQFDPDSFPNHPFTPDDYHRAAYACLVAGRFYTDTTLSSLIALSLLGTFLLNSDDRKLPDANFAVFGLAIRLAIIAGYHRDPSTMQQSMTVEEMDRRRRIWHELLASDRLHCMPALLPNSIDINHYDTQFPSDAHPRSYYVWKWKIGVQMARVIDFWTSARIPPYTTLQDIDASIRKLLHSLPADFRGTVLPVDAFPLARPGASTVQPDTTVGEDSSLGFLRSEEKDGSKDAVMQQQIRLAMHFGMMLFYLHRPCFMRSLAAGDASHELSVQTMIEACQHVCNLTEVVMNLNYSMSRWFSFAADLFSVLHCQTVLVVKTTDPALLAPRMALLEKGVGTLQWTASVRPNSKNRALLQGARRLLANAKQSQQSQSIQGLSPLWQDFLYRDPMASAWPATSNSMSSNGLSFADLATWDISQMGGNEAAVNDGGLSAFLASSMSSDQVLQLNFDNDLGGNLGGNGGEPDLLNFGGPSTSDSTESGSAIYLNL